MSSVVYVIVCVLLADGVHGRVKFTSIIGFGGCLDVGKQCERELWDTDDDSIRGHSCRVRLHQLHVDADLLAKVKWVIDHLNQLLQHVICGQSVGPVDCYLHHLIERKVIDAFEVASIRCS
jgi:hypothetical protein